MEPGPAGPVDTAGLDPLALRLALLQRPYRVAAALTRDDLEAADEVLRGWRGLVRHWALSPSKPMCAQYVADFLGALDDDLDTPAALRTLAELAADPLIPDGSKFEAFAHLDRFLGLDLAREVGR
jgi:cysteinyl-tRNA synthetase